MKFTKILPAIFVLALASCASATGGDVVRAIKGTKTAVIEVSLDDAGMPVVSAKSVEVMEGQRVVLVGPFDMSVRFPKGSPFDKVKFSTKNAVVNLIVPKQKWEKDEKTKTFKYDVLVGKKVLDPFLIIKRSF